MTLKRRLLVSNILMVAVPVAATLIVAIAAVHVVWHLVFGTTFDTEVGEAYVVAFLGDMSLDVSVSEVKGMIIGACAAVAGAVLIATVLMDMFLSRFLIRHVAGPLAELSGALRTVSQGNLSFRMRDGTTDEFSAVRADFNTMASRLEESTNTLVRQADVRRRLLADVAHDVRSPLTSIQGYAEGLRDGMADDPERRQRYLDTIIRKSEEAVALMSEIFEYSKLDLDEYPVRCKPIRLDLAVKQAADEFVATEWPGVQESDQPANSLALTYDVAPVVAVADPALIGRIVHNVLSNSMKYASGPQGVRLTITVRDEDDAAFVRMADEGPGVPDDVLPRLFDPLFRVDEARSRVEGAVQGSGVGLAFVRRAVDRMGGTVCAVPAHPRCAVAGDGVRAGEPRGLAVELRLTLAQADEVSDSIDDAL